MLEADRETITTSEQRRTFTHSLTHSLTRSLTDLLLWTASHVSHQARCTGTVRLGPVLLGPLGRLEVSVRPIYSCLGRPDIRPCTRPCIRRRHGELRIHLHPTALPRYRTHLLPRPQHNTRLSFAQLLDPNLRYPYLWFFSSLTDLIVRIVSITETSQATRGSSLAVEGAGRQ